MNDIIYKINSSTQDEIKSHLEECSNEFTPPLSNYVDIEKYSSKIFEKATRFEVYNKEKLVGLIAIYLNKEEKYGFITNVSLESKFQGLGISKKLLDESINYILEIGLKKIILEVYSINNKAINFYLKNKPDG